MGNSNIAGSCRFQWRGIECDLLIDDDVFIAKGWVIACNSMEAILDN